MVSGIKMVKIQASSIWKLINMYTDNFGVTYIICANCKTTYIYDLSNSSNPQSRCSLQCDDEYRQFVADLYHK